MRVLGVPIEYPPAVVNRILTDVGAIARAARDAPQTLERIIALGEELVDIGHRVLAIAERLDERAEELLELGRGMRDLGGQIDARGAEIVDRATRVVETGNEVIAMLPALERALELASPLEGAIDRFGRIVDRFPGGAAGSRRREPGRPAGEN